MYFNGMDWRGLNPSVFSRTAVNRGQTSGFIKCCKFLCSWGLFKFFEIDISV
jgi:hypothetical protein